MNAIYGIERPPNGLATFQAALRWHLSTQGIGLRPQPWAPFSRPVGPAGPATRASGHPCDRAIQAQRARVDLADMEALYASLEPA
jgi:hypothetical protein